MIPAIAGEDDAVGQGDSHFVVDTAFSPKRDDRRLWRNQIESGRESNSRRTTAEATATDACRDSQNCPGPRRPAGEAWSPLARKSAAP